MFRMHERSAHNPSLDLARRQGTPRRGLLASRVDERQQDARADKLRVEHTEYELSSEFAEAIEHAAEDARGTKIILRVEDVGSTYE